MTNAGVLSFPGGASVSVFICFVLQDSNLQKDISMKHLLQRWAIRGSLIAALTAASLVPMLSATVNAAPAGGQFSIGIGGRSSGYSPYGRGRYGYGTRYGSQPRYGRSYTLNQSRSFPYYGSGPYGRRAVGRYGWNQGYRSYSTYGAYNSNYYNPYSTWTYNPYGIGLQQSFGY